MSDLQKAQEEDLYERIASILDEARSRVARSINTAMVHAYWLIGQEIVEVEQHGAQRAGYGEGLMKRVAARLAARFGKGFSLASLKRMKQFYLAFPRGSGLVGAAGGKGSTPLSLSLEAAATEKSSAALSLSPGASLLFPPTLAWSHYLVLLRVTRPEARAFYEIEAARESWSVRELERQVGALLFERLAKNKSAEQVLELARKGQQVSVPRHLPRQDCRRRGLSRARRALPHPADRRAHPRGRSPPCRDRDQGRPHRPDPAETPPEVPAHLPVQDPRAPHGSGLEHSRGRTPNADHAGDARRVG